MRVNPRIIAWTVFLMYVLCACEIPSFLLCPYLLSDTRTEIVSEQGESERVYLSLAFTNFSETPVRSLVVCAALYDSDGNAVSFGNGSVIGSCETCILGESESVLFIDITDLLPEIPGEPYAVDSCYVREIRYEDDSVWKDPYGMFCLQQEYSD